MAKRKTERNRTNKNTNTISQQKARAAAAIDGRGGRLAAYTGGARTAQQYKRRGLYNMSELDTQREAWSKRTNVQTYTHTPSGKLSVNGRNTNNAYTNTFTPKNDDGSPMLNEKGEARQTGRSEKANRRQRDYDVRAGLNNITPKAMEAMIRTGQVRVVEGGGLQGGDGNVIRQKKNGNYTMGLSVG